MAENKVETRGPAPITAIGSAWVRRTLALGLVGGMLLAGCGGGGSGPILPGNNPGPNPGDGTPAAQEAGTARIHVDVATRKVTITPLNAPSGRASSRAVFAGTAVKLEPTELFDDSGDVGRKAFNVRIQNRRNEPIGRLPNGQVTGFRVMFSNFKNVSAATTDVRANVNVNTLAGNGTAGAIDNAAGSSTFNQPMDVVAALDGALYVTDYAGHKIRKIFNGQVTTFAGSGVAGFANGIGTAAQFRNPMAITMDPVEGSLYVADSGNNAIRRITKDGRVSTVAGTGAAGGTDGSGDEATFNRPAGIIIHQNGDLYVSEAGGNRIRRIDVYYNPEIQSYNTVYTVAGTGTAGAQDGPGAAATFNSPGALSPAPDGQTLLVADTGNNKIRAVSWNGTYHSNVSVTTVAGTGTAGGADGRGNAATLTGPIGIATIDVAAGLVVVSEKGHRVRFMKLLANSSSSVASNWLVGTLAGSTAGFADGSGTVAKFNTTGMVGGDKSRNAFIADTLNHRVRRVQLPNTLFQTGGTSGPAQPAELVKLSNPEGYLPNSDIAYHFYKDRSLDPVNGLVPSIDVKWGFTVPNGVTAFEFTVTLEANTDTLAPPEGGTNVGSARTQVRTFAGANVAGFRDGQANVARFNGAYATAADEMGNIFVADSTNHAIRRITADGTVATIAGVIGSGAGAVDALSEEGGGAVAKFNSPQGIAVSPNGRIVYVSDSLNNKIRRLELRSDVSLENAYEPSFWSVTTIAGTGGAGGIDGAGNTATFSRPMGIVLDTNGLANANLYVTEFTGHRVRRLQFRGGDAKFATRWQVSLVAGNAAAGRTDGAGAAARFNGPADIALDLQGNLYVADYLNHRIRKITNDGTVSTLAGPAAATAPVTGYVDGAAAAARFNAPMGIAVDTSGFVYVADRGNNRVRRISPSGVVATIAGTAAAGNNDGGGNVAQFATLQNVDVDKAGNLLVPDNNGTRIRLVQRLVDVGQP